MTRATICLAVYITLLLALASAMSGGDPWPMVAASVLCIVAVPALRRQDVPFYARRS